MIIATITVNQTKQDKVTTIPISRFPTSVPTQASKN